ncbi:MAG: oligosaccharide flippase family protein [Bacteroidales bacterium]|nr:oligosaccharide flippase family protein [Bacteroidales bacterium]
MRRKFITNLIFLLFLNFLIKPFWVFGIDRTVQNVVGPAEYGFYFAIFNFAFILQIILDMGITNFNNRNIARNNQLLSKHFSGIVLLRLTFAVIYLAIIIVLGYLIGYDSRQMWLLFIIGINQFLLTFILYLRSNISALLLFRTDSIISVLDKLFMILICSVLLWGQIPYFHFTIEWFVYAQTISYVITALIAFAVVVGKTNYLRFHWNLSFFRLILKKSFPYALLILLMGMYSRIDSFLIERLLPDGDIQAGIYASAFRLLDVANNMSGVLIAGLLLPIFARMIKQKKQLSQMVKLPLTLLIIISATVASITVFYSLEITTLLYHQHIDETTIEYANRMNTTSLVIEILMIVYIATSSTYIFGTLLTANGSLKTLNLVAFGGVILSWSLNFLLIPNYASVGSAFAGLAAQWGTAIIQAYLAIKILKLKFEIGFLIKISAFTTLTFIISYITYNLIPNPFIGICVSILLIVSLAFLLKLLNIKALIDILRNDE